MPPHTRRSPGDHSRASSQVIPPTSFSVTDWADTYESAERWVAWNARRRWPAFAVNDEVWALSVTAWQHNGQVAA